MNRCPLKYSFENYLHSDNLFMTTCKRTNQRKTKSYEKTKNGLPKYLKVKPSVEITGGKEGFSKILRRLPECQTLISTDWITTLNESDTNNISICDCCQITNWYRNKSINLVLPVPEKRGQCLKDSFESTYKVM